VHVKVHFITPTFDMIYYKNLKYNQYTIFAAPYDGPSLSIDFNTSCAHLTIQDPTQPNGFITEYQVS